MAYIGRDTDKISNVEVLDNITFDGSSSYTLQKGGSNFTPSSANTLLLSIDGVVQAGNFTVSGSTIDFGVAIAGTSTCDFILHYGVGLITAPSDGTVTTAKLADSSVSLAKLTATGTKDATTFLRGDNTFSEVPAGGITEADQWRLSADRSTNETAFADVSANLERNDNSGFGYIGSGMTESSGVFTFPATGTYFIQTVASWLMSSTNTYNVLAIFSTNDNSNYTQQTETHVPAFGAHFESGTNTFIFNCTNTSTHKVKFRVAVQSGTQTLRGNSTKTETHFNFIRLGDST